MIPINISTCFPTILLMVLAYTIWKQSFFLISLGIGPFIIQLFLEFRKMEQF